MFKAFMIARVKFCNNSGSKVFPQSSTIKNKCKMHEITLVRLEASSTVDAADKASDG